MALLNPRPATKAPPAPPSSSSAPRPAARPTAAQIRALLRTQIIPRGKPGRSGYRLPFRALTAGTAKVAWYRKAVLIAGGRRTFAAARSATITVKLTPAGRRALRHAKRLALTAKGTFIPAPDPPVTAARKFTLKR